MAVDVDIHVETVSEKKEEPSQTDLTSADGENPFCNQWIYFNEHTLWVALHAYEVRLAASKEKEQQLLKELSQVSRAKDQQISQLQVDLEAARKIILSPSATIGHKQGELQKSKYTIDYVRVETLVTMNFIRFLHTINVHSSPN